VIDREPVAVQQAVQLHERLLAETREQRKADSSKTAATHELRIGRHRRERGEPGRSRFAPTAIQRREQAFPLGSEILGNSVPLIEQIGQRLVEAGELVLELTTSLDDSDAPGAQQP